MYVHEEDGPTQRLRRRANIEFFQVEASAWRLVETGRVVLFTAGEHATKLAVIVEIIDHKRVRLHPGEPSIWTEWRHIGGMRKEKVPRIGG